MISYLRHVALGETERIGLFVREKKAVQMIEFINYYTTSSRPASMARRSALRRSIASGNHIWQWRSMIGEEG
jgi:hypothetical protein